MASDVVRSASTNWCLPGTVMRSALIKNKLSVCCVNIQSICARNFSKLDELRQISQSSAVDLICVTETWLNEKIDDAVLEIDGYYAIRHDRMGRLGGGILIFIKKGIQCSLLEKSTATPGGSYTEYIFVELVIGNVKLLFGTVYNPPEVNCVESIDCLMTNYGTHYNDIFLVGDFNTNLLNHSLPKSAQLISTLSIHNMYSLGSEPTFFHRNGSSQLDLMLSNSRERVLKFNQIDVPCFSNHDLIFASLDIDMVHVPNKIKFRDYRSMDVHGLTHDFNSLNWSNYYRSNDPNALLNFFNCCLVDLHDKYVPVRSVVPDNNHNLWFNNTIGKLIADRDLAYKQWKYSKSDTDFRLFKVLRNRVTTQIRKAKTSFYESKIDTRLPSKELWRRLKNFGVVKTAKTSIIQFESNEINVHFANNFTKDTIESRIINISNRQSVTEPFYFNQIDDLDVISALYHMKSNAIGLDKVPLKFLKLISPLILKPTTHLFNCIITTSVFPNEWKKSKVLPLKKKSHLNTLQNLRPISILSALSKVFERIIKNQISKFINRENLLIPHQSGYRPKHSTKTAMLKVFDDIGIILDKGRPVVLLLLDFSKAFDTISHKKLCAKLTERFGFSNHAMNLIKSYLTERAQSVLNDGIYSSYIAISSGVPQGSILGPILFSMYINDLPEVLKYCKLHIFADDVQLYFGCLDDSATIISQKINEDLANIHAWSTENRLSLNADKTSALFLSHSYSNIVLKPLLKLNNININFTEEGVSLGITIQSNFKFDKFIFKQCGKIYASLRTLYAFSSILKSDIKLKLFKSLILPHFIACDFLLGESSMFAGNRLKIALNSCVRYVYGLNRYASVSHMQQNLLGCPFAKFSQMRCCLFLFKLVKAKIPRYLHDKLRPLRTIRAKKYLIPRHNTSAYGNSFFVRGISYWNSLPNKITLEESTLAFKRKCIEHFNL